MDLKNIKIMGCLGGIFFLLSFLPYIGILLFITGFVLLFIAMYKISQLAPEKEIFKNFLIAFIISLVGGIIASVAGLMSMIPLLSSNEEAGVAV